MPPLRVQAVTGDTAFAGLEGDWRSLLAETPERSGFQSFAWLSACRAGAATRQRRLFTLVVRDGAETVGILPTQLGRRGDLCFLGDTVSNYLGPVYRAARLTEVVAALAAFVDAEDGRVRLLDLRGVREGSPFLAAWCALRLPGWHAPRLVRTARCPYVDLSSGWQAVLARRKSSSRTLLARKQKSLARLGRVELVETCAPDEVNAALPTMFRLFGQRWAGRHESGGFAGRLRSFHEHAAPALAAAGELRLSLLKLDGHVVAFSYGVRGERGTSSYVLAHDGALATHSPGAIVLTRLLEAACERGEREYDFSLGEEEYKDAWATGARDVFRVLHWRRHPVAALDGSLRALGSRAWDTARSVRSVRDLKRDGLRRWLFGAPPPETLPDAPGVSAGTVDSWTVHRLAGTDAGAGEGIARREWTYDEMQRRLSPRLLELTVERSYRNDRALALYERERLLGVAWRACPARRALVTGGCAVGADEPVYYHPTPAPGRTVEDIVRALRAGEAERPFVVVTAHDLPAPMAQRLARFPGDLRFRSARRAA